ncbi:MAG: hypothetical protein M3Y33_04715 [Actinomycetota bacterium]|nr:hypothetical protein [Actinomycetota bacterium]
MRDGYSYTTLSAHPGQPVQIRVAFYLDGRAWIVLPGAGTGEPHLHLSHGDVAVSIGPCAPGRVTAEDARIARELAGKAAEYAAEIERLHAASSADEGSDAAA